MTESYGFAGWMNVHGVDFRILGHLDVDQIGPAMRQRLFQRRAKRCRRCHARRTDAEGFRELDEIRIDQVGGHHAAVETLAIWSRRTLP